MKKRIGLIVIVIFMCLGFSSVGFSQGGICGDAPAVDDVKLKGELDSKAQFLSRFLGDASLKGRIESEKTDVLSKYPNADQLRLNQYFLYVVCVAIMADSKMTTTDKLGELRKSRDSIFAK